MTQQPQQSRALSGMRPTGTLHIGHYHGVLKNWVALQRSHQCFFFVADWHALTTHYEDTGTISDHTIEMVIDWLAVGLDAQQATLFVQSQVWQHAELATLLGMITPLGWLERVPSYKDQQAALTEKDLTTYGFLGYPVLQSADILLYRATHVPVGEDQVAHIEITREIARRFHRLFASKTPVLVEPQALLTAAAKLPGVDGRKMSKSYGNAITLRDDVDTMRQRVLAMPTDPARVRRNDPGNPDVCPVFAFHQVYSDTERQQWVRQGCTTAGIGCVECKKTVIDAVAVELTEFATRRQTVNDVTAVKHILRDGAARARNAAEQTMRDVRDAIGLLAE